MLWGYFLLFFMINQNNNLNSQSGGSFNSKDTETGILVSIDDDIRQTLIPQARSFRLVVFFKLIGYCK